MKLSVIVPAYNPDMGRLQATLNGLAAQTLPPGEWELLLVDNASQPPLASRLAGANCPPNLRCLREPQPGLSSARRCGFVNARADLVVLVDDDNVLQADYLEQVIQIFTRHPQLGAAGGPVRPRFEITPPAWLAEFHGLLACRDLGGQEQLAPPFSGLESKSYPKCAPVGAGLALRKSALKAWLERDASLILSDRRGQNLSSGGDNDIVFVLLENGWGVGYFPQLALTHLIPGGRLQPEYLARLNRGIAKSWVQVLSLHDCNPWPPVAPWTVPWRQAKAWVALRAWAGPVEWIRWHGACGMFEGLAQCRMPGRPA